MCVICVKKPGVPIPHKSIFETCFDANGDGAGLAYALGGEVRIIKGLMDFTMFNDALKCVVHEIERAMDPVDSSMMFHFRIGTHGSRNDPRHTHPFPIVSGYGPMQELVHECGMAVAHNGILSITGLVSSSRDHDRKDFGPSDTMEMAANVLEPLSRIPGWLDDPAVSRMIKALSGYNRLALLSGDGRIYTFGDFEEDGGMMYSNSSYKVRMAPVTPTVYPGNHIYQSELYDGIDLEGGPWGSEYSKSRYGFIGHSRTVLIGTGKKDKGQTYCFPGVAKGDNAGMNDTCRSKAVVPRYCYRQDDGMYDMRKEMDCWEKNYTATIVKGISGDAAINRDAVGKKARKMAMDTLVDDYIMQYENASRDRERYINSMWRSGPASHKKTGYDTVIESGFYTFYRPTRVKARSGKGPYFTCEICDPAEPWYISPEQDKLYLLDEKTGELLYIGDIKSFIYEGIPQANILSRYRDFRTWSSRIICGRRVSMGSIAGTSGSAI